MDAITVTLEYLTAEVKQFTKQVKKTYKPERITKTEIVSREKGLFIHVWYVKDGNETLANAAL